MKLLSAHIEYYVSLVKVDISFASLTTLVGKNGSRKTNLSEALNRLFGGLAISSGVVPSGFIDCILIH